MRQPIELEHLVVKFHNLWANQWLLLTCGDFEKKDYNAMTVGWGSLGTMWGRPFAQVVVRPQRYTFEFMNRYDTFTLCVFPLAYHKALNLLGTKSGRQTDKIKESGLTPIPSSTIAAPSFAEAELILECQKIYWQDMDPSHFMAPYIAKLYNQDYHRIYFGEIKAAFGEDQYRT